MSSIDERIVEMKFNNGQFQRGVADTSKSLDALKKGLNFDGASKSLQGIEAASRGVNLGNISSAVETIASRFTALGMVGVTALVNISNQAINTGLSMVRALTIQPIMDGFNEYELKMGSIQTILANTARHGTNLEQVTGALDELNQYADKTIYNFGDMTKNIGLFTNAGLKVEDATSMIKGFSNEAAASGTSAQGAAGAAYQLSQALSAGTIRLMDWRSLQNVGMGNKNMQNGLIEMADAMGTLTANSTDATEVQKDFNGSLEKNWLSADVMSNYLKIMAGDMTEAEQAALGLSEAQIAAFAKQAATAEEAATKVRTWTQLYGTLQEAVGSSWAETFDIIIGDFNEATDLFTAISDRLGGMIGAFGDQRNEMLTDWDELGGRTAVIDGLSAAFEALMQIVDAVSAAFTEIFPPMTGEQLAQMSENFKSFMQSLKMGESDLANLKSTFKGFFAILSIGWQIVSKAVGMILDLLGVASKGSSGFLEFTGGIGDFLVSLDEAIKKGDGLTKFFEGLGNVLKIPLAILGAVGGALLEFVSSLGNLDTSGIDGFAERVGARLAPLADLGGWLKTVWEGALKVFSRIAEVLAPVGKFLGEAFANLGTMIADGMANLEFSDVLDGINTGLLGGLVLMVANFFKNFTDIFKKGGGMLDSITGIFDGITGSLEAMQTSLKAKTLITIAIAIGILAASVVALSLIDSGDLTKSLTAITVMFTQLMGTMAVFTKIAAGKGMVSLPFVAAGLILISIAVAVLAGAVSKLAGLSWEELAKGLTGVIVLLGALVGVVTLMPSNPGKIIATGLGLLVLAAGISVLASAVQSLSGMSWEEMSRGLVGVGALLIGLGLFTKMSAINKGATAQAIGIVILAAGLKILASAVGDFASMSWESMLQGLIGVGAGLLILAGAMALMPQGMLLQAASLVVVGAALQLIASAVQSFGSMSWEEIGKGLVTLAGALGIIAIALMLMGGTLVGSAALLIAAAAINVLVPALQGLGGMSWDEIGRGLVMLAGSLVILAAGMYLMTAAIPGAIALLIVSAALTVLVPVLQALGNMSWEQIGTGLGALAATLGILALAGIALLPALPGLIGLGVALLLVGVGVLAAGIGVAALAAGLTLLAAAGAAGTAVFVAMGTAFIGLIPMLLQAVGEGIILLAGVIANSGPQLIEAFTTLLLSMIQSVRNVLPEMIAAFTEILMALIESVNTVGPALIDTVFNLIMTLVDNIVAAVPRFVEAGMQLITGIINGIANQIGAIIDAATNLIVNFLNGIANNIGRVIQAGINLIISFVQGLADGIRNNQARMNSAGLDLAMAIVDGMTGGLASGVGRLVEAARNMAGSAINAAKEALGINSPSKEFFQIGAWSAEGQAIGMEKNAHKVVEVAENTGNAALTAMQEAFAQIASHLEQDMDWDPVIRPIVDLSDIDRKTEAINGLFNTAEIPIEGSYQRASSIAEDQQTAEEFERIIAAQNTGVNLTFNQNNTSPESLSDIEIYRKTNNLLSQAKGALEKV